MSTTSAIALTDGDGFTDGIYVHSDGYPTWMGAALFELADRVGFAGMRSAIELGRNGGWSMIDPGREERVAAANAEHPDHPLQTIPDYLDERGEWVAGVGYRHTDISDEQDAAEWRLSWHGGPLDDGAEWVYALDLESQSVSVFDLHGDLPQLAYVARYGAEVDWERAECGANFERCNHYAWYHFPEAEGSRLDTQQFLGRAPITVEDACAVVDEDGQTWLIGGSGYLERLIGGGYGRRWFCSAKLEADPTIRKDIHTWSREGRTVTPAPDLTFVYPPTAAQLLDNAAR